MEQAASPSAHASAALYVSRFTQCTEFAPGERHVPTGIFCRPTGRDVARVLAAWLTGRRVPTPMGKVQR